MVTFIEAGESLKDKDNDRDSNEDFENYIDTISMHTMYSTQDCLKFLGDYDGYSIIFDFDNELDFIEYLSQQIPK